MRHPPWRGRTPSSSQTSAGTREAVDSISGQGAPGFTNIIGSFTKISHEKPSDTGGTTEHAREQPRTNENQQDKQSRKDSRNDKNKQSQKHRQKHTSQTPAKKAKTKPTSQKKGKSQTGAPVPAAAALLTK